MSQNVLNLIKKIPDFKPRNFKSSEDSQINRQPSMLAKN